MRTSTSALWLLVAAISISILLPLVLAGSLNQNDDNGKSYERGTGKINGQSGCIARGGDVAVELGPPLGVVWGGPCCAANQQLGTTNEGNDYYEPNQCCNPPDYYPGTQIPTGLQQPGNHCECFAIRGYTPVP